MKKIILLFIAFILLISCSCGRKHVYSIRAKLDIWEKSVYDKPGAIRDSLIKIRNEKLTSEEAAHHALLSMIAYERLDSLSWNDSLNKMALKWYRKSNDSYNLCRSLLYDGIAKFIQNRLDSSAFYPLKEAESIYTKKSIEDKHTGCLIYYYLGKVYRMKEDSTQALIYLNKSTALSTEINSVRDMQKARLEMFWEYLADRKYGDALSCVVIFEDTATVTPSMQYDLYNAMHSFYMSKKEYNIAIEYTKKMLQLKKSRNLAVNEPKLYSSLSRIFRVENQPDSSFYYAQLCVNSIIDTTARENHIYYRALADMYSAKGDNLNASKYYRKAYFSYLRIYSRIASNKAKEIEKKFDISLSEERMAQLRSKSIFLSCFIFFVLSSLAFAIMYFRTRIKSQIRIVQNAEKSKSSAEIELKKALFLNELLKASASLMPQFIDDVNKEAARDRKISKEISDNLNSAIDNIRALSRNKMTSITKDPSFYSLNPNLKYLNDLSDFEKIILLLMEYNLSTQEISELLNSSPSSIRSIKTKIKEKILAMDGLPFDPQKMLQIFK